MASELRDLIRTHDVEPWIATRKILVAYDQIPHSHPVLTIHTRHIGGWWSARQTKHVSSFPGMRYGTAGVDDAGWSESGERDARSDYSL
jgi:hypothetical protein